MKDKKNQYSVLILFNKFPNARYCSIHIHKQTGKDKYKAEDNVVCFKLQ